MNWTRDYFESGGIVQPRLEAEILLAHSLDVDRLHLYLAPDKPLSSDERERYRALIQRRRSGEPLQHLTGEVSFFGLRFRVGSDALIPRAETEELVDHALRLAPRDRPVRCLDLGTGSGVVAVTLARFLPLSSVTAVDISRPALELARANATLHRVDDRIDFVESDWFEHVSGTFDLITSNPPYVPSGEIPELATEIRDHEPRAAVDGGEDGLDALRTLVAGLSHHLEHGGHVLLEVGHNQARHVASLLEEGGLASTDVRRDVSGKDRFVVATCP
ncbi:MAG: peptide chain release factor N(5)-glutamine methyltransferase [Candidatus Bipolaricaulota bacterium]|nr:MAG: peptide chain release factor N(5)-glutamine methyltransferase [Candidatus Bipolaricaulota bacterium]